MALSIEEMAIFCKKKGFVYPNSEIYGGIGGFFDYGPLGSELKNNIKQSWWKRFVHEREDIVGIDGTIITNPKIWVASGHVDCFSDFMVECKECKKRFRADHLIKDVLKITTDGMSKNEINSIIQEKKVKCPYCKSEMGTANNFNLMFTTNVGPTVSENSTAYLRPETAQLIFADFKAVMDTSRKKLPFGIAQMGKAFRNEISPREFLFRTREFEQMEIEFFIHPMEKKCPILDDEDMNFEFQLLSSENQENKKEHGKITSKEMIENKIAGEWHVYWLRQVYQWFIDIGIKKENLRLREHLQDELAHYSSACFDIEYKFPFGWQEIHGNANRGQFDLMQHEKVSKKSMAVFDEETKEKVVPRVIEPSQGTDRAFLAVMFDAYLDDKERGNIVLKINSRIAPVKLGVFPLVNKLNEETKKVYDKLKRNLIVNMIRVEVLEEDMQEQMRWESPYCITFDFESRDDNCVTVRDRDTTEQKRIKIDKLVEVLDKLLNKKMELEEI